ncbi:hypothetical protein [Methylocella silvestris]|nr:hypothetical protein [Methylocella silvestris]
MRLGTKIRGAMLGVAVAALGVSGLARGAFAAGGLLDGFSSFNWGEFFTYHGSKEKAEGNSRQSGGRHLFCPEIIILEGTAAAQTYAGSPPTNMNLRYQYALGDVVRECAMQGDQLALKIGVAGKVLLGPAGAPASFSVPLRVAIISSKDNDPIVTKLYRVAATIPQGEAMTEFTLVTEPLLVPFIQDHTEDDYTIKVGIDEGAQKAAGKGK